MPKNLSVLALYQQLLKKYGPQGWWPIFDVSLDATRYGIPYRRLGRHRTPYRDPFFEIAAGAILTQNTAWTNVIRALRALYSARALTASRILKISSHTLATLIRPSGYFQEKAKKLKILAAWWQKRFAHVLFHTTKRKITREEVLALWGVGPETADSILLYAFDQPYFVVDAYTRRWGATHGLHWSTYDEWQNFFHKGLARVPAARKTEVFREFHALIVEWGKQNNTQ